MRTSWVALNTLMIFTAGCASHAASRPTTAEQTVSATPPAAGGTVLDGGDVPADSPTWAISAAASGASEGEAYGRAQVRLLAAALGLPPSDEDTGFYGPLLDAVHRRGEDGFEIVAADNSVRVSLGVAEAEVPALYARLEARMADWRLPQGPSALQSEAESAVRTGLASALCKRQLAPPVDGATEGPSACHEQAPDLARTALNAIGARIRLSSAFDLGIPTSGEGTPLRPVRVTVTSAVPGTSSASAQPEDGIAVPLEGLSVRFTYPGLEASRQLTDDHGAAKLDWPEGVPFANPVEAKLDLAPWLGPFAEHADVAKLVIPPHAVDSARAMLMWSHRGSHDPRRRAALLRTIQPRVPVEVTPGPEKVTQLPGTGLRALSARLPAWVDGQPSPPDVVLFAETQSEFASRMGTQRVWYEARGRLVTLNAWTGKVLGEVQGSVTESGLGEERAEQAAIDALLKQLGEKWIASQTP